MPVSDALDRAAAQVAELVRFGKAQLLDRLSIAFVNRAYTSRLQVRMKLLLALCWLVVCV